MRQETTSVGETVEETEPSLTAGGNRNWYGYYEHSMKVLQKVENRVTMWPSNPSASYLREKMEDISL